MARQSFFLVLLASIDTATAYVAREQHYARDETPGYPHDDNTSKYCSYWIDNVDQGLLCAQVPAQWGIPLSSFLRWVYLYNSPHRGVFH
jgi:hypothetical protein